MASFTKRYGKWQARLYWIHDGKRHFKTQGGFSTKALAKQWAASQEDKLANGIAIDKEIGFASYFDKWYQTYKDPKISRVTKMEYRRAYHFLNDYFKDQKIKNITRLKYQKFINQFGKNHAPATVRKFNGFYRACVKSAILDDYLTKDFTQSVELAANKDRIVKVEYLNVAEIKKLVKYTTAHLNPAHTSSYMILTAIYTGMRKEEIQALTWADIDFIHQTIDINKAYDEHTHEFKPVKTVSSKRKIKVNADLLKVLSQLKLRAHSTLVFFNDDRSIPTSNALNKQLHRLLQAINADKCGFHFHSLRHSHVALLLSQGIDIYAISKRLGHSNIKTTANIYAYMIDEYRAQTDKQIIKALSIL